MEESRFKYCPECGGDLVREMIEGRPRLRCRKCGEIHYENPFPATALVCLNEKRELLLVRRSEEPCVGWWCLPGGFIEMGETVEESALRELKEETGLDGELVRIVDVASRVDGYYGDVVVVGYQARIIGGHAVPGDDASEVRFFPLDNLPKIAFDTHQRFVSRMIKDLTGNKGKES